MGQSEVPVGILVHFSHRSARHLGRSHLRSGASLTGDLGSNQAHLGHVSPSPGPATSGPEEVFTGGQTMGKQDPMD